MNKIGIWNTAFLGDAVLTLPLIRTVHHAFPEAEVHFWVRGGLGPLFAHQPELAGVHEYRKRGAGKGVGPAFGSALDLGRAIARQGYGLWISAHSSLRSGLIARWSSVKMRIGYDRPLFNSFFYTHTVPRRFRELDEIERLLQLVRPLGLAETFDWPELALDPAAEAAAGEFWARRLSGAPVLGVHPGSVWPTKRWPAEFYGEVARRALDSGARVLVFGGPGEEADAARVVEAAGGASDALIDVSGALSLPELAAYLDRLDCYLSNDSGPMHLAWARRTPVVAVFGPTVRSLGFFPRGASTVVQNESLACRPCGLHGPRACPQEHFRCMRDVAPDAVWAAVRARLDAAGTVRPGTVGEGSRAS
jgi:heptosyltransferase-2